MQSAVNTYKICLFLEQRDATLTIKDLDFGVRWNVCIHILNDLSVVSERKMEMNF